MKKFGLNSLKFFSIKFRVHTDTCYYKLLNLGPNASFEEVKKEYYKLAKKYHPDNTESSANQTVKAIIIIPFLIGKI